MAAYLSHTNIISPLGFDTASNFEAIVQGAKAVRPQRLDFSDEAFCVARVEEEKLDTAFSIYKGTKALSRLEKMSVLSLADVILKSNIEMNNPRTLLLYTTTKGNIDLLEAKKNIPGERIFLPAFAEFLGRYFNCRVQPLVVSNACISGLLGIIIAKRYIDMGKYDQVVVCGGDIVSEFTLSGFKSFNALSPEPCRPFDAARNGINLGEAVATVLVTKDKPRQEPAIAIVSGASANDANHISGPHREGQGLLQAIEQTLKGITTLPDFISAHGTATPYNDEMESIAFERAGLSHVPLNSLKGYYGHTLGAAGVLETVLSAEALRQDRLIPSAGYATKGVSGAIEVIAASDRRPLESFLKTASGFGGCNAAALFVKQH